MIIPVLVTVLIVPLALPLVLAAWHLALWRFADQAPPLVQRERSVSTRGRVLGGLLGVGACYLLCAAAAFTAARAVPSQTSLTLDPIPNSPAAQAGVRNGDVARGIDGRKVETFAQLTEGVRRGGDTVEFELVRDGEPVRVVVAKGPAGKVGITSRLTVSTAGEAAGKALAMPAQTVVAMAGALVGLIARSGPTEMAGPVGVARQMAGDNSSLPLLALLLSHQLPKVALVYALVLALDAFARRRYLRKLA